MEKIGNIWKLGVKTSERSEKWKNPTAVSKNALRKPSDKRLWLGELPSLGFWGLKLTHTCIHIWFCILLTQQTIWLYVCRTGVGRVLEQNLALPSSSITSFNGLGNVSCPHAWDTNRMGVPWDRKMWIFVAKLWGYVASQGTPRNAISYTPSLTDLTCEVWMHLTLSSKSFSSTSPQFSGGKVS